MEQGVQNAFQSRNIQIDMTWKTLKHQQKYWNMTRHCKITKYT